MKSYVKPQKGKVQQASPPFLTVMVRTARDPRPPAWRPSVHCGQDGVARGSPCCPLPGPTGSGVWNDFGEGGVSSLRSVQLQTQREPEERCSEHREPRSSPPRARWGACCVLPSALGRPAAAPRLSRPMPAPLHMRPSLPMPLASPAGRAGPPGSADAGPVPLASGPGASRVSAPRLPSYTGRLGAGSSAPPRSELRPPCGPFPRVSVSPSALPVPVHGRPAAGWTGNSPRHPAQSRRPGVFLPCGDAGVGNVRPVLSLRLMKRIPQSCFTFSF